jgi:DNA-binding transcriptional regulator YdaS (Cro superfamily)
MNLSTYLSQERGRKAALAKFLDVPPGDVTRWLKGQRPIPDKYGAGIERFTGGLVTRQELFPDEWRDIWPELARRRPKPQLQPQ